MHLDLQLIDEGKQVKGSKNVSKEYEECMHLISQENNIYKFMQPVIKACLIIHGIWISQYMLSAYCSMNAKYYQIVLTSAI